MQALDGFDPDEAECRELVHALSGPVASEAGPSSEGDALQAGSSYEGGALAVEATLVREAFEADDVDTAEASQTKRVTNYTHLSRVRRGGAYLLTTYTAKASEHDPRVPPAPADAPPAAAALSKRAEVHAAPRRKTRAAAHSSSLGRHVLSKYYTPDYTL
eukprot:scaffold22977_cov68-Phaeocystis_antarctica.AAC.2